MQTDEDRREKFEKDQEVAEAKQVAKAVDEDEKAKLQGKLELLEDDDIADLGVDLDVGLSSTPGPLNKVACMTCEMVGGYESEEIEKLNGLVFNVMRMQECGHGIVYGVLDDKVREKIATAKRLQDQFTQLAQSGDEAGAKRKWKKLNTAVTNIKIRQRIAWGANSHRIDMPAIPELNHAA